MAHSNFTCYSMFSILSVCASSLSPAYALEELPRRIMLGTAVQPVSEETRQRLGLRNTRGVEVIQVVPESTAMNAGILKGDVILSLGDKGIANPASFVEMVSTVRGGKELSIRFNRDGKEQDIIVSPKELPQETAPDLDIEYSAIESKSGRLRTVLSMPKNATKAPVFVLLSGLGNGPAEHPSTDPLGMKGIAYALNKSGFAALRVDKPGCGDSEGGPAKDASFESVVEGYVAAVRQIKKHPRIDVDQVCLLGVSMGGLQAPLVAAQEPVRGIAIFGAMSCNWPEYMQNTTRRQMKLSGAGAAQIEEVASLSSAGWHYFNHENLMPDSIAEKHPELTSWVEQNWIDGKYFSGINYTFFQQLCHANIAASWEKYDGPVLSMWGESDFVTTAEDHEFVAWIANQGKVGRGEFRRIPGVEHNLRMAASVEEAMTAPSNQSAAPTVVAIIDEWAKRILNAPRG